MSFFVKKLAPIVLGTEEALKCPDVYRCTSEVFPTPPLFHRKEEVNTHHS
jgi:hypothetical protein